MKKVLAMILALAMVLSIFCVNSFAEEAVTEAEEEKFDPYAAPDDTTVRVTTYEQGTEDVGPWLNKYQTDGGVISEEDVCVGYAAATFNAGAPVKAIIFERMYAGKSENIQDADIEVSLYAYDTDYATSVAAEPLFTETRHRDGDKLLGEDGGEVNYYLLPTTLPAGKYVLVVKEVGTRGSEDATGRYVVLPSVSSTYSPEYVKFENGVTFGFMVDFEKTEGVEEYFTSISGEKVDYELEKEQNIAMRNGSGQAYDILQNHGGEYAILTPVIPDGKVLFSINLVASPTWSNSNGDSNVDIYVYRWKGDYDETVEGKCLFEGQMLDHLDNTDLVITFDGKTLRYGDDSRYLIVLQACEGQIGYWEANDDFPEDWAFFGNAGEELEICPSLKATYALVGDLGPIPTEEPTAVPTEAPTAAPTDVPVETEAPTEAPKATATKAPAAEETEESSNVLPIIIIAACALVVVACVVVVIIKKKKG